MSSGFNIYALFYIVESAAQLARRPLPPMTINLVGFNGILKILEYLFNYNKLKYDQAKEILIDITSNKYSHSEIASFMTIYKMRNPSIEEMEGFRDALLEQCIKIDLDDFNTIDLCGTGGDGKDTFNISTISSFVVAGSGFKVTKHGNKLVSKLNNIFIDSALNNNNFASHRCVDHYLTVNTSKYFTDIKATKTHQIYESFIFATQSDHSLACDDRKFYYDPIRNYFLPIYNDGKSTLDISKEEIYTKIKNSDVTENSVKGANDALKLISDIDDKMFFAELEQNGFSLNFDEFSTIITFTLLSIEFRQFKRVFLSVKKVTITIVKLLKLYIL